MQNQILTFMQNLKKKHNKLVNITNKTQAYKQRDQKVLNFIEL